MAIVDANYILRYLLNDIDEQSQEAARIIEDEKVTVLYEVIAEVVYVLQKVYSVERTKIAEGVTMILNYDNVTISSPKVIKKALNEYSSSKLDFVDCILFAYSYIHGEVIHTFDKKLNRLIDSK
jgi:predicted nucleic-acid-binding protein